MILLTEEITAMITVRTYVNQPMIITIIITKIIIGRTGRNKINFFLFYSLKRSV